eukprot:10379862-Lingulodinium_polyedra.AAC.1
MPLGTIAFRMGAWPFAVAYAASCVLRLEAQGPLVLRGDGEPALQLLLKEVASRLAQRGKICKVEGAT